jgi:hypothetical protein
MPSAICATPLRTSERPDSPTPKESSSSLRRPPTGPAASRPALKDMPAIRQGARHANPCPTSQPPVRSRL